MSTAPAPPAAPAVNVAPGAVAPVVYTAEKPIDNMGLYKGMTTDLWKNKNKTALALFYLVKESLLNVHQS